MKGIWSFEMMEITHPLAQCHIAEGSHPPLTPLQKPQIFKTKFK
jgi:hypothetical protein